MYNEAKSLDFLEQIELFKIYISMTIGKLHFSDEWCDWNLKNSN